MTVDLTQVNIAFDKYLDAAAKAGFQTSQLHGMDVLMLPLTPPRGVVADDDWIELMQAGLKVSGPLIDMMNPAAGIYKNNFFINMKTRQIEFRP